MADNTRPTPLIFMRDIPKGQLPDNLTVDTGEDLIEAIKFFLNKGRWKCTKRGGKPSDTTSWKEHPYGIPISKSKTLRLYVCDKLQERGSLIKEKELYELRSKVKHYEKVWNKKYISYSITYQERVALECKEELRKTKEELEKTKEELKLVKRKCCLF